jgi:hypothetical protein
MRCTHATCSAAGPHYRQFSQNGFGLDAEYHHHHHHHHYIIIIIIPTTTETESRSRGTTMRTTRRLQLHQIYVEID